MQRLNHKFTVPVFQVTVVTVVILYRAATEVWRHHWQAGCRTSTPGAVRAGGNHDVRVGGFIGDGPSHAAVTVTVLICRTIAADPPAAGP
jgi:hypothetical protein